MKIKEKMKKLYSFDIFDTLVTRKCAIPTGIFAIMGDKIKDDENFPKDFRENFYKIRCDSERQAREVIFEKEKHYEILFEDIYEYMLKEHNLSEENINYLMNLEKETEIENLIPIEENLNKLKCLIKQGENVVLISDMYYASNDMREILSHIDTVFEKIKIYVSGECKVSKGNKRLYKTVKEKECVEYKNWYHYGDNSDSDYKNAKKLGIKSKLYNYPSLKPYERDMILKEPENSFVQYLIGTARLMRFNKNHIHQDKYEFGASYTAPFFYNYVNNIISESLKLGAKTLYFVARDGYIPKVIADIIIKKHGLNLKTKYIYGSRKAWFLPCEENYLQMINKIFDEFDFIHNIDYFAYRLNVESEKLQEFLGIKSKTSLFKRKDRIYSKKKILKDENLKKFIIDANAKKIELLKEYIKQEIDLSEDNIVFVELNGSGNTQDTLARYINSIVSPRKITCHSFFLFLTKSNEKALFSKKYAYCSKPKPFCHAIELTARTNHGQTLSYEKVGNRINPVFEKIDTQLIENWGYEDYLKGINDYTESIANILTSYTENVEMCSNYFDFLVIKCDKEIADIVGSIPFSILGNETCITEAAPKATFWDCCQLILINKYSKRIINFPFLSFARRNDICTKIMNKISEIKYRIDLFKQIQLYFYLKKFKDSKIMFWGASIFLADFIDRFKINSDNILGIIDINFVRHGQKIGKYEIFPPEKINNLNPDLIVFSIKNSNELIYYNVKNTIRKNYPNVKLSENIFTKKW